ncbi:hypothetical protein GOODEAATRI_014544 [Goodea atripinnis]|uniref:F-box domain-containing protein n=1 Tax=Goodea atripinnis TaxID=208336 RepID=A0ABV0MS27_9TELE
MRMSLIFLISLTNSVKLCTCLYAEPCQVAVRIPCRLFAFICLAYFLLQSKGDRAETLSLKRKSSSLLDARIAKIYRRQLHSQDGDDSASDDDNASQRRRMGLSAHGGGHLSRKSFGANRRGLLRGGLSHKGNRGGFVAGGSMSVYKLKRGMGMKEVGRRGRVRLRGGSRMQRRGDDSEESDDDEDDDEDDDDDDYDEDEGDSEEEKEYLRQKHRRRRRDYDEDDDSEGQEFDPEEEEVDTAEDEDLKKEDEEEEDGRWDSDPEPPVLLVSDLNDDLLSGSYLTVTLQQPHKAKTQSGSIVPKLEAAMGLRSAAAGGGQQGFIQRKAAHSKPSRVRGSDPADTLTPRGPGRPRLRGSQGDKSSRTYSASSSEEDQGAAPAASLPSSLLSLPSFKDAGSDRGGEKEVWVSVFRYLNRAELLACMTVCKAWYKWSCDKRLWSHIDVSRGNPLSNQALAGIIKRHPTSLDLSWTSLAMRQLNCLLTRLPGTNCHKEAFLCASILISLHLLVFLSRLEGTEADRSAVVLSVSSGLSHSTSAAPAGSTLTMNDWNDELSGNVHNPTPTSWLGHTCFYSYGSYSCLESSRSRLRNMVTLRLSGLDVSESTLRLLQRHMPQLETLDLAHCKDITDSCITLLAAAGTHTRNNLSELTLAGCNQLTDGCLSYLKRFSSLTLLDLRGCKGISRRACDAFISDLSHVALYCMMEEKLIQRLD